MNQTKVNLLDKEQKLCEALILAGNSNGIKLRGKFVSIKRLREKLATMGYKLDSDLDCNYHTVWFACR